MSAEARNLPPPTTDLARILDGLTTSVLLVDRGQTLLYLNVAAETLLGVSRDRYANYEDGSNEMPYWLLARLEMVTGKDVRFWVMGRAARDLRIPLGTLRALEGPLQEPAEGPQIPPKAED